MLPGWTSVYPTSFKTWTFSSNTMHDLLSPCRNPKDPTRKFHEQHLVVMNLLKVISWGSPIRHQVTILISFQLSFLILKNTGIQKNWLSSKNFIFWMAASSCCSIGKPLQTSFEGSWVLAQRCQQFSQWPHKQTRQAASLGRNSLL